MSKCHGWKKGTIHSNSLRTPSSLVRKQYRLEKNEWNAIKLMLSAMQTPKIPCDICHQEFESEGFVQLHKMSDHEKKFGIL